MILADRVTGQKNISPEIELSNGLSGFGNFSPAPPTAFIEKPKELLRAGSANQL
jgi:hypothetical protein